MTLKQRLKKVRERLENPKERVPYSLQRARELSRTPVDFIPRPNPYDMPGAEFDWRDDPKN